LFNQYHINFNLKVSKDFNNNTQAK